MNTRDCSFHLRAPCLLLSAALLGLGGCAPANVDTASPGSGGASTASGGRPGSGGASTASGGTVGSGGAIGTGGTTASGGAVGSGGATVIGGTTGSGGRATGSGGSAGASGSPGSSGGAVGTGGGAGANAGGAGGRVGSGGSPGGTAGRGGTTSTGGVTGSGGAASTGGAGGAPATCTAAWTGSATRPQLTDASAACFTIQRYLAQTGTIGSLTTDNWNPVAGLPAAGTLTPTFTVAGDGSGTHTTVQAAVTAAKTAGGTARAYILVKPGMYRELVCVDGTVPMTLYGAGTDATAVTIVFDNYSGKTVDTTKTNACAVPTGTTYGTSGSSTFFVKSNGFQALNLTVSNDFAEGTNTSSVQAVAMTTQGDQGVFQNVRFIGNQDTLQIKSPTVTTITRAYFKSSYIEGDTDFIFGRAATVFDDCTIFYVGDRRNNSTHISPSTEAAHPFGFLIINSRIMGGAGVSGTALLGRSWDDSSGTSPNGQAIIRETAISAHIRTAAPWGPAATSDRAFDAATNRLYEYKNTGAGAAP